MAQHKTMKLTAFLVASTLSSMSYASGFAIIEQSVTGLGRAFAGSAAVAEDASTIFFNPAGLTQLKHMEVDMGLHLIAPQSEFNNNGSSHPLPDTLGGGHLSGGDGGNAGSVAPVPNFYVALPFNDTVVAGFGVSAPFGLVTEYDDDWVGRYHAIKSDMLTINFNPSIAFKATDRLSLGFGINLQYIEVELSNAIDLGGAYTASLLPDVASAAAAAGLTQNNDGIAKLKADDWSWGYNLGLTFQATDATRIGLAYRSKISHHLTGKAKFGIPNNPVAQGVAAAGNIINGRNTADVDLPESASLAIHHQINDQWAVMADASWTRWDRFQELAISLPNGTTSIKEEKWDNSMRYGLGLTYAYDEKWTFRSGIAFDETPISDNYRTARIPGEDRTWVAVGASYKYSENMTIDAGYTHIFLSDPKINEIDDNGYTLSGDYDASVDILSIQARWVFM